MGNEVHGGTLQDANRANYPPGAWDPGPLQWQFMQAIDGLFGSQTGAPSGHPGDQQ